jgi:hypothetical protein
MLHDRCNEIAHKSLAHGHEAPKRPSVDVTRTSNVIECSRAIHHSDASSLSNFNRGKGSLAQGRASAVWRDFHHAQCGALQFAEAIFEGMKAYREIPGGAHLFRPLLNYEQFSESARRMGLPVIPRSLFIEDVCAVASACPDAIPGAIGASLYLRPLLVAIEPRYAPS